MELIVVRHGIAVELGTAGVRRDGDRMLSKEGQRKTRLAAEGLAALGIRPDLIATSPLVRAVETARILANALGVRRPLETSDVLAPGWSPEETIAWLRERSESSLMLVGHMPDVADLAATLASGSQEMGLEFKKACVCGLTCPPPVRKGGAALRYHLPPSVLRRLAGAS
jgi:phosphohistidine phosphatase